MYRAACFMMLTCFSLTAEEAGRCSIKTTSDQYGYSTDYLYNPATEETCPIPINPAHSIARQKLATLNVPKRQLTLEDGSRWTVPEAFIDIAAEWKEGDLVVLSHPQSYDGSSFNLNLWQSNQGIRVEVVEDPQFLSKTFYFKRLVRCSDANAHKIYLNDETAWDYDPDFSFQPIFAAVPKDAPVSYAINTGPDALRRPILLVSFSGFPPDRIAVRSTDP
ncbi:MAG: hypothetical protein LLG04_12455 [Parachlamydia sp.]|nr:hypothetical protein [Parachlamydia sp.]